MKTKADPSWFAGMSEMRANFVGMAALGYFLMKKMMLDLADEVFDAAALYSLWQKSYRG
jgi:hypothetical protein